MILKSIKNDWSICKLGHYVGKYYKHFKNNNMTFFKWCNKCKKFKCFQDFHKQADSATERASACRVCKSKKDAVHYKQTINYQKERNRRWASRNPERVRIKGQKRRARIKKLKNSLTELEYLNILKLFDNSCAYCNITEEEHIREYKTRLHQDHIIPLSEGGSYTASNIVPACVSCNSSKSNKDMVEWYKKQKFFSAKNMAKIKKHMKINN